MKNNKKIKVANLTIIDPVNIGNRLQNYAVQELLREKNCNVDTLYYYISDESRKSKILSYIACILRKIGIYGTDSYIKHIKHDNKMLLTKHFNDKYISFQKKYIFKICKKSMKNYSSNYDYFCVGSDQIWNAALVQNNEFLFMSFAPSHKTFALSASMGTTYVPEKYKNTYVNGLKHVGNISVRESNTAKFISDLVGRKSEVLLDPTLLIDLDKWNNIAQRPNIKISKKYITTYFLGPLTSSQKKYVDEYARENDFEIIDINGKYKDYIGPSEFLYLISNSEFVFTDSFHGTAFSIIFSKKFITFQRNNSYDMSSRIVTILNKFDLLNHFYETENNELPNEFMNYVSEISKSSYDIKNMLTYEKNKANKFIDKCLGDM